MLRKSFVLPVLSLVLLSACQSGNETLEKQNAEILAEMKRINARLDGLEKQAKQNSDIRPELIKINAKLDALDKRIKQARTVNQPHVLGPVPPDRNKLSRIKKLPPNPTDQQIIDYIRQIREATVGQTVFSNTDPQLSLYEQIGPGHLHLLLPYLNRDNYLTDMLPKLVGETDKELVRRSLKHYPVLIKSVVLKGWLKEMKKEIMTLFKMPNVRVYEIRDCIPELVQTPDELKIVTGVYIHKPDGFLLLDNLKLLPGVDLRKLVNQAWVEAQKKYPTDEQAMIVRAQHAIQYGGPNVEAVKYLLKMRISDQPGIQTFRKQLIIPFLTPWCDFPIYDQARLREWYDKNADRIVYDPSTGKYVIKSGENLQKLLTSLGVPVYLEQAKCDSDALTFQAKLWNLKKKGFESGVIPLTDVLSEELRFIDILRKSQNLSESVKTQLIKKYSKRLDKIYSLKKAEFEAGVLPEEEWKKCQKSVSDFKRANNIK